MRKYLLPKAGKFYKANLHMHTTISDGNIEPDEVKRLYLEQGYSIVAFSDHEVMVPHHDLTDDNFLAITSTEISINENWDIDFEFQKTFHFNLLSEDPLKDYYQTFSKEAMWLPHSFDFISKNQQKIEYEREYSIDKINEMIRISNEENCLVLYCHPIWSLQDYSDYINLEGLWGIEWFNTGASSSGYYDSMKPIDDLLRIGKNVYPVATDDAHYLSVCFGGFVMVKAENLKYNTIFKALKSGDFYSSKKPLIHELYIEDGIINLKCSPVSQIVLYTERRYTKNLTGYQIEEAQININDYLKKSFEKGCQHPYVRLTLIDQDGNEAQTRAYHLHELL